MPDRPIFASLDDALRWAYRHEPRMMAEPSLTRLAGKDQREDLADSDVAPPPPINPDLDRRPVGLDAAAQKGFLQSFVLRQPIPERLHLLGKYAIGEERKQAQRDLRDYLTPLINNVVRPKYVLYMCVARFYGRPVVFKDLAFKVLYLVPETEGEKPETRMGHAWRMVRDLSHDVEGLLKDLATRAEEQAHKELQATGVIV